MGRADTCARLEKLTIVFELTLRQMRNDEKVQLVSGTLQFYIVHFEYGPRQIHTLNVGDQSLRACEKPASARFVASQRLSEGASRELVRGVTD